MIRSIINPQASTNLRSISRCSKSLSMDLQITHVALGIIDLFMNSDLLFQHIDSSRIRASRRPFLSDIERSVDGFGGKDTIGSSQPNHAVLFVSIFRNMYACNGTACNLIK